MRRRAVLAVALALPGCLAYTLFRHTVGYGFDYDDYHLVRPYTAEEVIRTFSGPWDTTGIEVPFYRPLTIAFFALRFEAFGLNADAYHRLGLVLFGISAALAGWLGYRFTGGRLAAAALAALFFATHPAMPYAAVVWVTNQMHLVEMIVVLAGIAWWDAVKARSAIWWMPLFVVAALAFLLKEDAIMLLPVLTVLHFLRRHLAEPQLKPVPLPLVIGGLTLLVVMFAWRSAALHGLGGYSRPTAAAAWHNFSKGLDSVFRLVPPDRPWQPAASWFATVFPLAALVCWRRTSQAARFTLCAGAAIAVLFGLPFVLVSKAEQLHLVAAGASIVLTGAAIGLIDAARFAPWRAAVIAGAGAGIVLFAAVARDISRDFEPFGPIVLAHDRIVAGWAAVPPELKEYLAQKRRPETVAALSPNPARAVQAVTFGVHGTEIDPHGVSYRWMASPRAEIHVRRSALRIDITMRHAIEAFRQGARARLTVDGRPVADLVFDDSRWQTVTALLRPADVSSLSGMHRVQITVDRVRRPSEVIPGSRDTRLLGLQVAPPVIR